MGIHIYYIRIYWESFVRQATTGFRSPSRPLKQEPKQNKWFGNAVRVYQEFVVLAEGIYLGFVNHVLCIANIL